VSNPSQGSKWQNEAQQEDPSALTTWAPGLWNFFQGPQLIGLIIKSSYVMNWSNLLCKECARLEASILKGLKSVDIPDNRTSTIVKIDDLHTYWS
jgi:hypothetical protein